MNTLKKAILLGGILFAADVAAFGHIDMRKFRQSATIPIVSMLITACATDPECKPELSDLSSQTIEAARYVVICRGMPRFENTSVANFAKICESNSECREMIEEAADYLIGIGEECMLDYECKMSLKSCFADKSCQTNYEDCMNHPTDENPACKKALEVFPEGWRNL